MMRRFITISILAAALWSCSDKAYLSWNRPVSDDESFSHEMMVLGEQLSDPYSVDNMTKALQDVAGPGRGSLEATDFYVRFLPKDDGQYRSLLDKGLLLMDHPLDYRIVREGDWYHDPDLPEDGYTWQYAVVPVNFDFPSDVRYERLDECFLPEHSPSTKSDGVDWEAVERAAFRVSGNEDLLLPLLKDSGASGAMYPQGRISIVDAEAAESEIGVKGVMVCCNSFVKIGTAFTDAEGNYKLNRSFSTDVRYRLVFQNSKGFCQGVNLVLVPASMSALGKHEPQGYSLSIDSSSETKLFTRCVVNNAGWDYLEACSAVKDGLPSSPKDLRIWNLRLLDVSPAPMMHQGVLLETHESLKELLGNYSPIAKLLMPDVLLGLSGKESYREIYGEAMHAFAQAGHYMLTGKEWWHKYVMFSLNALKDSGLKNMYGGKDDTDSDYCEIAETYACFCRNVLCARRYPDLQEISGTGSWFYPQLFHFMQERGLELEKIAPLLSSDVVSMDVLKLKLLSYYPEFKSTINEAFVRYDK